MYIFFQIDSHPQYNYRNGKNDIAILHLESPVAFTDLIHPACLPLDEPLRSQSFVDYQPFIAGWGKTQEGRNSSQIPRESQLPVLANRVCKERYSSLNRLVTEDQFDNSVICAGILRHESSDVCLGDFGGPLMYPVQMGQEFNFYVIGIASYGVGCGNFNAPSVYTNVPRFIDWIKEKIFN